MQTTSALIKTRKKLSSIWLIPLIAFATSLYLVAQFYLERGPEIKIIFDNAEGIEAGKTLIKALNVQVGVVERVQLNENLQQVTVTARIDPQSEDLLRQDTQFWVVKPRIGSRGISGLSTLLSGAYIELEPGQNGYPGKTRFDGLTNPPLTPNNKEGLNLSLISDTTASVSAGAPVLYKGFRVGQVTNIEVLATGKLRSSLFVEQPYDKLVTNASRFFNASGVGFSLTAEGMNLYTESLETIISGGVAFDLPKSSAAGQPAEDGLEFVLYRNYEAINVHPYQYHVEYLMLFETSVRALLKGAPVEYRGIRVGSVVDMSFNYLPEESKLLDESPPVPVLVRLDPGRLYGEDSPRSIALMQKGLAKHVKNGLRASLKTGSLFTGKAIVALDFYEDEPEQTLQQLGQYEVIPTISADFMQVADKAGKFFDKLNAMPIETTVANANDAVKSLDKLLISAAGTMAELETLLANEETQQIPASANAILLELKQTLQGVKPGSGLYQQLNQVLQQLQSTLKSVGEVTNTLETKPNSLIFSDTKAPDLIPGGEANNE